MDSDKAVEPSFSVTVIQDVRQAKRILEEEAVLTMDMREIICQGVVDQVVFEDSQSYIDIHNRFDLTNYEESGRETVEDSIIFNRREVS